MMKLYIYFWSPFNPFGKPGFLFGLPGSSYLLGARVKDTRLPGVQLSLAERKPRLRNMPAEPLSTRLALAAIRHVRSSLSVALQGGHTQLMPWSSYMGFSFAMVIHPTIVFQQIDDHSPKNRKS